MLEKLSGAITMGSILPNGRVHDFIKGWGQVTKSGKFVRWDHYKRPKKGKKAKAATKSLEKFTKFMYPVTQVIHPVSSLSDIFSVQPLTSPTSHGQAFIPSGKPPRKVSSN